MNIFVCLSGPLLAPHNLPLGEDLVVDFLALLFHLLLSPPFFFNFPVKLISIVLQPGYLGAGGKICGLLCVHVEPASVIRADVGVVDVYWSQKIDVTNELERVVTEQKSLRDDLLRRFDTIEQRLKR